MKKYVAFCGLLASVIIFVTVAGIVLLVIMYAGWRDSVEDSAQETPEIIEDLNVESAVYEAQDVFQDVLTENALIVRMPGMEEGQNLFSVKEGGEVYYFAWGIGAISVPEGVTQISTGSLEPGVERAWASVEPDQQIFLSDELILLR